MNRRKAIKTGAVLFAVSKNTFACNDWGRIYVVEPELKMFIRQEEKSYNSLGEFLDDRCGKGSWTMSIGPSSGVAVNDLEPFDIDKFIDKWEGVDDTLHLVRDHIYKENSKLKRHWTRINYETNNASKMEVNYFLEIKNARERWGIGSNLTQYIQAASFVVTPEVSPPEITLRVPRNTNIVLTIKKANFSKTLVTQPMLAREYCGGGPEIEVGTQEHADKLNAKEQELQELRRRLNLR